MNLNKLNGFISCPFCSIYDSEPYQKMYLYAEDFPGKKNTLFCPHCDFEFTISNIYYGVNDE